MEPWFTLSVIWHIGLQNRLLLNKNSYFWYLFTKKLFKGAMFCSLEIGEWISYTQKKYNFLLSLAYNFWSYMTVVLHVSVASLKNERKKLKNKNQTAVTVHCTLSIRNLVIVAISLYLYKIFAERFFGLINFNVLIRTNIF